MEGQNQHFNLWNLPSCIPAQPDERIYGPGPWDSDWRGGPGSGGAGQDGKHLPPLRAGLGDPAVAKRLSADAPSSDASAKSRRMTARSVSNSFDVCGAGFTICQQLRPGHAVHLSRTAKFHPALLSKRNRLRRYSCGIHARNSLSHSLPGPIASRAFRRDGTSAANPMSPITIRSTSLVALLTACD